MTGALRDLTSVREREDFSESQYDEWSGYGGSLFQKLQAAASGLDDAEDNEADSLFTKVDEFMDSRRRKKRDEKVKEMEEKL